MTYIPYLEVYELHFWGMKKSSTTLLMNDRELQYTYGRVDCYS